MVRINWLCVCCISDICCFTAFICSKKGSYVRVVVIACCWDKGHSCGCWRSVVDWMEWVDIYWKWVPKTTAYKRWNCQVIRHANCLLYGFPDPSQFAAAKLTHYSTIPHRLSDSSRPRQRLLLSGDMHQNPGPSTKWPCSVCTRNVPGRGVRYMCNCCSGWVNWSVMVFKTQWSTDELRTGHAALAVPHPLHQYRNRFHHNFN